MRAFFRRRHGSELEAACKFSLIVCSIELEQETWTTHGIFIREMPAAMVADAAPSRVLVVGAGLTGALVSRSLRRLLPASSRVVVWEADSAVGGRIVDGAGMDV